MIDIEKTANLARLAINAEKIEEMKTQVEQVLSHFEKLESVSTENIDPMVCPTEIEMQLREDVVESWDQLDLALEQAPQLQGQLFRVPPVV